MKPTHLAKQLRSLPLHSLPNHLLGLFPIRHPAKMHRLPDEILTLIAAAVDDEPTLVQLWQTSRAWNRATAPVLYRKIRLKTSVSVPNFPTHSRNRLAWPVGSSCSSKCGPLDSIKYLKLFISEQLDRDSPIPPADFITQLRTFLADSFGGRLFSSLHVLHIAHQLGSLNDQRSERRT